jgi:hypothetical protein
MVSQRGHVESSPIGDIYAHGSLALAALESESESAWTPTYSASSESHLGSLTSRTSPKQGLDRQHSSSHMSQPLFGGPHIPFVVTPIIDVMAILKRTREYGDCDVVVAGEHLFHDR